MTIEHRLQNAIRDIPDFPKPGILFKDITPVLQDPGLCRDIIEEFYKHFKDRKVDVIVGVESRGFLFGLLLAQKFNPLLDVESDFFEIDAGFIIVRAGIHAQHHEAALGQFTRANHIHEIGSAMNGQKGRMGRRTRIGHIERALGR